MTWQNTFTGRKVFPLDFDPGMVALEDVAHGLAGRMRYACQCWVSVAQHSVAVLAGCERLLGKISANEAGYFLFHDASEAYLFDLTRPIRGEPIFAPLLEVEVRVQAACYVALGVDVSKVRPEAKAVLEIVDPLTTSVERRFFRATHSDWRSKDVPRELFGVFNKVYMSEWEPRRAEKVFLETARRIGA